MHLCIKDTSGTLSSAKPSSSNKPQKMRPSDTCYPEAQKKPTIDISEEGPPLRKIIKKKIPVQKLTTIQDWRKNPIMLGHPHDAYHKIPRKKTQGIGEHPCFG